MGATCPNCHVPLETARPTLGRLLICQSCGKAVPVAADASPRADAPRQSRAAPKRSTLSEVRSPRTLWYIRTADGTESGPITKSVLDQMAHDGRLAETSRIRQQGWSEWVPAKGVYAGLRIFGAAAPAGELLASTLPDVPTNPSLQQAPRIGGAATGDITKSSTDPALVVAAIILFTVVGLGWLALRHPWQETLPAEVAFYFSCYGLGAAGICAAVLNWRRLWWFRKARFFRGVVSEKAARWFCGIVGGVVTLFALERLW
jgi:hypothetical protein